ncbi:hypothetical protein [Corynebacterium sp. 335C]
MYPPHEDPAARMRREARRSGQLLYLIWVLGMCVTTAAALAARIAGGQTGWMMVIIVMTSPLILVGAIVLGLPLLASTPATAAAPRRVRLPMYGAFAGWFVALWVPPDFGDAPPAHWTEGRMPLLRVFGDDGSNVAALVLFVAGLAAFAVCWAVMCWRGADGPGRMARGRGPGPAPGPQQGPAGPPPGPAPGPQQGPPAGPWQGPGQGG